MPSAKHERREARVFDAVAHFAGSDRTYTHEIRKAREDATKSGDRFVETTVAKYMLSHMDMTHSERGITVVSGPWGIGKTTAIDAFARRHGDHCAVIKVEPGVSTKRGTTAGKVMQLVVQALRALRGRHIGTQLSNSTWTLRQLINNEMTDHLNWDMEPDEDGEQRFTFIFDEAQYLSKDAIDVLRFWNDHDRTTTPLPVGLIFVGNNEFAMDESHGGDSVLSGAVRSRLLFELSLDYSYLSDLDLTLFAQSMGVSDVGALREFIAYFDQLRVKRDLRMAQRLLSMCIRDAPGGNVNAEIISRVFQRR